MFPDIPLKPYLESISRLLRQPPAAALAHLTADQPRLAWLLAIWAATMICLPLSLWTWGEVAMRGALTVSVLAQAAAVFEILRSSWGWRRTLGVFGIIALFTFSVEFIGSTTGFPFGRYHYTGRLLPHLGHVPLLIPIAWFMMLPGAWAVAAHCRTSRWRFALVSAAALTAWDLLLDPQMVNWGLWVWDNPYGYFGIPWSNYAGWLLTGFLLTLIVRPEQVPERPLLFIYTLTGILNTLGLGLFWGLPGPALIGGLAMGLFAFYGWRQHLRSEAIQFSTQRRQEA
jgi:lycopene beta-cyclase